jgi:hypothetical protein
MGVSDNFTAGEPQRIAALVAAGANSSNCARRTLHINQVRARSRRAGAGSRPRPHSSVQIGQEIHSPAIAPEFFTEIREQRVFPMNCGAGVGILYSLPAEDRQTCRNRLKYRSFVVDCHKWRGTCRGINRNQGARRSVRREAVGKFRRSRTSKIHGYRSWCFRETRHSIRTILPRCLSYFPQGIHLPRCNIHARAPP